MKNLIVLSASAALLTLSLGCNNPNCEEGYYIEREPYFRTGPGFNGGVQYYGGYGNYYGRGYSRSYGGYGYYRGPRVNSNVYVQINRPYFENHISNQPQRNFSPRPQMHSPSRNFAPPPRGNNSRHR